MLAAGNIALACLLSIAGCSAQLDTSWGTGGGLPDPYLLMPPGSRPADPNVGPPPTDRGEEVFSLRHIYHHGSHEYPRLHRYRDVAENAPLYFEEEDELGVMMRSQLSETLVAKVTTSTIERMKDRKPSTIDKVLEYAAIHGEAMNLPHDAWTLDDVDVPNAADKETVLTFARIAANAYVEEPFTGDWIDVRGGFNYTDDFGWEKDGLRGHIFANQNNKTIIIGLKGTTPALFDGPDTTENDKINDNLFGSCCCGEGGQYLWKAACHCMTEAYTCNNTCLVKQLNKKDHYFKAGQDLYQTVLKRYPEAEHIWLSGHSLGGVVSSLLGLLYGAPVMTFEAFPDSLAASRLGLPTPPGYRIGSHAGRLNTAIHHFGHTADPIFTGTCNSASAGCTFWGYAFEGHCHAGKRCTYDTVGDHGWSPAVTNHRILFVLKNVYEKYETVPKCDEMTECSDCYLWKFFESNGTETTTTISHSSSSTRTRTRTETCKTPGWWGCLDKTTTTTTEVTTTTSLTSTSSSSSTSTCKTPGWFGCKDPTTTTTTTTASNTATPVPTITTTIPRTTTAPPSTLTSSSTSSSSGSITCETPGWFGCKDLSTTTTKTSTVIPTPTAQPSSPPVTASTASATTGTQTGQCSSKKWFGLICADPSLSNTASTLLSSTVGPKLDLRV